MSILILNVVSIESWREFVGVDNCLDSRFVREF